MFKRTKSYLLLTLLVLTGFGGRIHSDSLSGKERRFLLSELKETKKEFLQSIKGLSEEQLNFKPSDSAWSIKDCAYHIALSENSLWKMAEAALKQEPDAEKRKDIKFTDDQVMKSIRDRSSKYKTFKSLEPQAAKFKNLDEAVSDFKDRRSDLMKFIKTTTDDLRNHVMQTPMGALDEYQFLLFLSAHTSRHTLQIGEIKSHPEFPE